MKHVTFEQAKLLENKGFHMGCEKVWAYKDSMPEPILLTAPHLASAYARDVNLCEAPEQHEVVEWLDEKDIYVSVIKKKGIGFDCSIRIINDDGDYIEKYNRPFITRQTAYSAEFDYILNHDLI